MGSVRSNKSCSWKSGLFWQGFVQISLWFQKTFSFEKLAELLFVRTVIPLSQEMRSD